MNTISTDLTPQATQSYSVRSAVCENEVAITWSDCFSNNDLFEKGDFEEGIRLATGKSLYSTGKGWKMNFILMVWSKRYDKNHQLNLNQKSFFGTTLERWNKRSIAKRIKRTKVIQKAKGNGS